MTSQTEKQVDSEIKQNKWGPRFKAAREAMNMTEKDAATRLHLKPHIITIIETERFQSGPPPIFMRGYLKSYAKLLNFSEKEIEQILLQLSVSHPEIINTSRAIKTQRFPIQHSNYSGWMTTIVAIVLIGLVVMWWSNHTKTADNSLKSELTPIDTNASNNIQNAAPGEPTPHELLTQNAAPPAPPIQTPSNNVAPSNTPVQTYTTPPTTPLPPNAQSTPGTTVVPNDTRPPAQSLPLGQPQPPVPGASLPAPPQSTISVPSNQALPTGPQNPPGVTQSPNNQIRGNTNGAPSMYMHPVPPASQNKNYDNQTDLTGDEMALPEQGLDTE